MFNITNYTEHPTRPGYYVFKFRQKNRSDYFEELLKNEGIWYELSIDDEDLENHLFLFGVKLNDYQKAINANYLVSGKFRKKTISNSYVRLIVYIVAIGIISLAIIGALSKT